MSSNSLHTSMRSSIALSSAVDEVQYTQLNSP